MSAQRPFTVQVKHHQPFTVQVKHHQPDYVFNLNAVTTNGNPLKMWEKGQLVSVDTPILSLPQWRRCLSVPPKLNISSELAMLDIYKSVNKYQKDWLRGYLDFWYYLIQLSYQNPRPFRFSCLDWHGYGFRNAQSVVSACEKLWEFGGIIKIRRREYQRCLTLPSMWNDYRWKFSPEKHRHRSYNLPAADEPSICRLPPLQGAENWQTSLDWRCLIHLFINLFAQSKKTADMKNLGEFIACQGYPDLLLGYLRHEYRKRIQELS